MDSLKLLQAVLLGSICFLSIPLLVLIAERIKNKTEENISLITIGAIVSSLLSFYIYIT